MKSIKDMTKKEYAEYKAWIKDMLVRDKEAKRKARKKAREQTRKPEKNKGE